MSSRLQEAARFDTCFRGETMRVRLSLWAAFIATLSAVGCNFTGGHNLPPATQLAQPGPGVGGPGPGVLTPPMPPIAQASAEVPAGYAGGDGFVGGEIQYEGAYSADCGPGGDQGAPQYAQVLFSRPESMQINWDIGGVGQYDSAALVTPGRQSFQQGGIYRLKISNIEDREGVELYPTIEVGPPSFRTAAYLAHAAIPIQFTEEDFDQVLSGNFVTKVIYLPDPEYRALAVAGVQTLVSTRLNPDEDPITEAQNKGAILAVVRIGNKDMETPGGAFGEPGTIIQAGFSMPAGGDAGCAPGAPCASGCLGCLSGGASSGNTYVGTTSMPSGGMPPGLVSGMTAPQYGMTMSGTPIGLPGPPHIPLGVPAGLKKHVIRNWTRQHIPDPVSKVKINVKQRPGISYPTPPNRAWISEEMVHPSVHYGHHMGPQPTSQIHYNCGPGGHHGAGGF